MFVAGYIASILIGLSLGLVGGGGSILTVPVLVYLFGIDAMQATYYSLFIVGSTSLVGAFRHYRQGNVQLRVAALFGVTSIATILLVRRFLLPLVPKVLFSIGDMVVTRQMATMILFALLMVAASLSMIRGGNTEPVADENYKSKTLQFILAGIGIGVVTGVLGAGGGFLLIPALVLLLRLPMKQAVGTSLLIIALNSLSGFAGDLGSANINWQFLLTITGIAVTGILVGTRLSRNIPGHKLKKGFGWLVLIMGIYIFIREIYSA
jgi:uncharacterized membrane protein YfcA